MTSAHPLEYQAWEAILRLVSHERRISLRDLRGPRRDREYVDARALAAALGHMLIREWPASRFADDLHRPRGYTRICVERIKKSPALKSEYARLRALAVRLHEVEAL